MKSIIVEKITHIFAYIFLCITLIVFVAAILFGDKTGAVSQGSFDSFSYNEGWTLEYNGSTSTVSLPFKAPAAEGEYITISNTLPDNLVDGMNLMFKSTMQDVFIYVNGDLREEYSTAKNLPSVFNLPSSLLVVSLDGEDAGQTISIRIQVKAQNQIGQVRIGHGNNVWFYVISNNLRVDIVALIVLMLGLALSVITLIIRNLPEKMIVNAKPAMYIGLLMVNLSVWILGESDMKPLFFKNPALSHFFVYTSIELICVFASMYINEVQHRKHNRIFQIIEVGAALQFFVNFLLEFLGIVEFYKTLIFSHIWMLAGILVTTVVIIMDLVSRSIKRYKITAIGILGFVLMSIAELVAFYSEVRHSFGAYICIGLLILMITTIIELLMEANSQAKARSKEETKMVVDTIETIASAIDARDKYTGGHSARVGEYAGIIAREMAADYDFTEDDIQRITYIGLMHDIGKIGVADTILNKSGKLTDEEFTLMKKHAEIGYELVKSMGENIEGLLDGVRHHHERFDGKGYPDGLSETEIPLVARILCLADCYDAMTSNRVYRKRLSDEEVKAELLRCSGTQFDPGITDICVRLIDRGVLKPATVDGMEIASDGTIPQSSLLENHLQKDLLKDDSSIINPTHVRMVCYVTKLMEKKGQIIDIFFVKHDNEQAVTDALKQNIRGRDINIEYTGGVNAIVLFEKTEEEASEILGRIKEAGGVAEKV